LLGAERPERLGVRLPQPEADPDPSEKPPEIDLAAGVQPLNFRVGAEFRREFKTYAAAHDMIEAYRKQQGD
jgi:hypothetical protein